MTLGNIIFNAVGIVEGVGLTLMLGRTFRKESGVLRIDRSNPEKDRYRFEIDDLNKLSTKKYIVLKVDNTADLS